MTLDIKFPKTCKREGLIPTFANVCLSIKQQNLKLKVRISRTFMENELQMKHREKRNLKKDIKAISFCYNDFYQHLHTQLYSIR